MTTMVQYDLVGTEWTANLRSGRSSVVVQNQSSGGPVYVYIGASAPTSVDVAHYVLDPRAAQAFSNFGNSDGIYLRSEYATGVAMVWG